MSHNLKTARIINDASAATIRMYLVSNHFENSLFLSQSFWKVTGAELFSKKLPSSYKAVILVP
jgi:hypothetical protein